MNSGESQGHGLPPPQSLISFQQPQRLREVGNKDTGSRQPSSRHFHQLPGKDASEGCQGQSSAFLRAWARPSCWSWRVSWGRQGRLGLTVGTDTGGRSAGDSSSVRALLGCHQDLAHPNACRLWCWDTSGQTTSMVGTQPLPSADWLPKDFQIGRAHV